MQPAIRLAASAFLSLLLAGCGSTIGSIGSTPLSSLTGNWQFNVHVPQGASLPEAVSIYSLAGNLAAVNGTLTGILHAQVISLTSPCVVAPTDLPVTGTSDASGNVIFTLPLSGGTATVAASFTESPNILSHGSIQITGGVCAQPAPLAFDAFQVPNLSGTYTGILTQQFPIVATGQPTIAVTATFVEAPGPTHGAYPVTGTVTATGACTAALDVSNGLVSGASLQTYPLGTILVSGQNFEGAASPPHANSTAENLLSTLTFPSGCPHVYAFSGGLTRQ